MNFRISVLVMGHVAVAFAQTPEKVEFSRDVLPILRQNCTVCHGPTQQISGLRIDRRSSMMKAVDRRIIPGNSGSSRLFLRLTGSEFGPQMPPTGALPPDQIATIRKWIDQGPTGQTRSRMKWNSRLSIQRQLRSLGCSGAGILRGSWQH